MNKSPFFMTSPDFWQNPLSDVHAHYLPIIGHNAPDFDSFLEQKKGKEHESLMRLKFDNFNEYGFNIRDEDLYGNNKLFNEDEYVSSFSNSVKDLNFNAEFENVAYAHFNEFEHMLHETNAEDIEDHSAIKNIHYDHISDKIIPYSWIIVLLFVNFIFCNMPTNPYYYERWFKFFDDSDSMFIRPAWLQEFNNDFSHDSKDLAHHKALNNEPISEYYFEGNLDEDIMQNILWLNSNYMPNKEIKRLQKRLQLERFRLTHQKNWQLPLKFLSLLNAIH